MSKKVVWFGSGKFWWCNTCNLPLASDACSICDSKGTNKVEITPPFDPRPAFEWDISTMNSACLEQFGCTLIDPGVPVVMNRLPSLDRAEEAVAYGRIIARIFFDGGAVRLKPTAEGAALLLLPKGQKKRVVKITDSIAGFLKDGDLLAPGVENADTGIAKEDWVIIESENFVAVGIAKMSGQEMIDSEKGKAVKVKGLVAKQSEKAWKTYPSGDWRKYAVAANSKHLSDLESEAVSFIRNEAASQKNPRVVSFSGGKDSLAVLLLVEKALGTDGFKTIFIDTGLEFPETVEYVAGLGRPILKESAGDFFWKNIGNMGPPARDKRWCCKVCKLGPAKRLINREFPDGCLSFMGERRYESLDRARRPRVDVNPWIEQQVHAYPILDWTALDVWLYIFSRGEKYNPLYEKGFTRIGCWLCPACDPYDFSLVEKMHPGLWGKWKLHCSTSGGNGKAGACSGV